MKTILTALAVMLALALPAGAKLNVVATTPDFGAVAREIGGDKIELITLAKPSEDPHFVDAKPSFIAKLSRADVLIEGGAELEVGWLPPLVEGSRNPKLGAGKPGRVSCVKGIALLEVPATLDRSKGDLHAAGNPHYTTDPSIMKTVAVTITESFCAADPKSADAYRANLASFARRLDAKIVEWRKLLEPFQGRRIVTYHNSWIYFAQFYGVKMDLFLEPKPGIPPSPSHLVSVVKQMKADGIKVIVVEPHLNHKTAETVANLTGAKVLDFAPYPGGKGTSDNYIDWMDALVKSLAADLTAQK